MLPLWAREATKRAVRSLLVRTWPERRELPLAHWRLARDDAGRLHREGLLLEALLERFGSPLHLLDMHRLEHNAKAFLAAAPQIDAAFSYKTNPTTSVLERLHRAGMGAEVISPHELWLALELGVPPARIIYNGPGKSDASLREAVKRGVLVNANARPEIARVAQAARAVGVRARVGVRVIPVSAWSGQFGERIESGAAMRAAAELSESPDLCFEAIHAHLGFALDSELQARRFVSQVLDFRASVRRELGVSVPIVDLGGSLPTPTVRRFGLVEKRLNRTFGLDLLPPDPDTVLGCDGYLALLRELVDEHASQLGGPPPRIQLEPGRAIVGDAQLLLTRILSLRDEENGVVTAVLDAGINVAEPVPDEYHEVVPLAPGRGMKRYRLVGPICTPADTLCHSIALPALARGDALAILDSGAYFVPFATSFSFPRPAIVAWDGGDVSLARRRENDRDMTLRDQATAVAAPRSDDDRAPRSSRRRSSSSVSAGPPSSSW